MSDFIMETERLILRPWHESDAEVLYKYASDPRVGPAAGWPPHTRVENSREIIRGILSEPETYAVVLKETGEPVGSVGIMKAGHGSAPMRHDEAEIGYWIGVPYWGQGLIPEAVRRLISRCFDELGYEGVWCGYFDGNTKSRSVMKKCGFMYNHTEPDVQVSKTDYRTEHFTYMTRERRDEFYGISDGHGKNTDGTFDESYEPDDGAEVVRVYAQPVPALRLIGKRYSDADRVNGLFSVCWEEFADKGYFQLIRNNIPDGAVCEYGDKDAYVGAMCFGEGVDFEYWVGILTPEGTPVPDGFDYHDFTGGRLGVGWLSGNETNVYCKENTVLKALEEKGYKVKPDENGIYWVFERYCNPRFTECDERGHIILDICFRIE